LLAIANELQRRGLGEALIGEGLSRLHRRGARRVSVVTQGRSSGAVRFYQKCGFNTRSCQFWYHRWFDR
jgi:ribosomal protein S18 acetylase RimI-like enzyme